MPTGCPAIASRSRLAAPHASIDLTVATLFEGENSSRSPTASRPLSTVPARDPPVVELVDRLDRQAQRQVGRRRRHAQAAQRVEHARSAIPSRPLGRDRDIVAVARRDRDDRGRADIERLEIALQAGADLVEARLVEIDQVHLVDHDHELADAEEVEQEANGG